MTRSLNLLQGTLDLLVLRSLAGGARHGYEVARWVREVTDGAIEVEDGALYTSLHRMEKRGWLRSDWGISEKGRRAKYYALTAAGRKHMGAELDAWTRYAEAVFKVIHAPLTP
jgi:transcriptional regulator